jgi:hypothetical protein
MPQTVASPGPPRERPARLELYPADTHDFQIFWSFLSEAADAVEHAVRFLRGADQPSRRATTSM